jgi:hypothetical protein
MVSLGIARGFIEIGLARLQSQRQVAISTAKQIGTAYENAFKGAAKAVQGFSKQMDSTRARLKEIRGELTALSVSGAALTGFGLKAADNLRTLQIRFRELAGDEQKAAALMQEIADAAKAVGLPVRQTQSDFAGLVPAIRDAGEEVGTYLNLVSRLNLLNPREGTSGAIFAIREALTSGGTDLVSLAERFNIPRKALRELIAETGSFSKALDILLDKQGATTEAAQAQAQSLAGASARLRDASTQVLERAFTPALQGAANILDSIAAGLEAAPDALVEIGGAATIAVTGVAGLLLVLSQVLNTIQNIKKAGALEGLRNIAQNRGVQRAAVGAGALAVGTAIGIGGVQAFGRATGNERLANFNLEEAGRILKQGLFLIVSGLIEGARFIGQGFGKVLTAVESIPEAFNQFRGRLEIAFGNLLTTLGNFIANIPGGGDIGAGVRGSGESLVASGEARFAPRERLASRGAFASESVTREQQMDETFDNFQLAAARAFGLVEAEFEDTANTIDIEAQRILEAQAEQQRRAAEAADAERKAAEEFLSGLQERIAFEQQYTELLREGTPEQVSDRIDALEREREAIEKVLPELEALAATNEDAAKTAAEYNQRLGVINEQTDRLGVALSVAISRAVDTLDTEFAEKISEIEAERSQALAEVEKDFLRAMGELDSDVSKKRNELRGDEIEALEDFQKREQEIIQEHRDKVLEIERKSRNDILDAAARLDAAGVFAAQQSRQEQLAEEDKNLQEQRAKNDERLGEQREKLSEEAQQLVAYYNERRGEIDAANQAELNQIRSKFDGEIQTAQSAYQAERQQLFNHLTQQNELARNAQNLARQIQQQGLQGMLGDVRNFVSGLLSSSRQLQQSSGSSSANAPSVRASGLGFSPVAFQSGGVPSFPGSGEALAFVGNKERILTPQQTASFDKLVGALTSATTGNAPSLDNVQIDVSGVDSFEMLVARVTRQVLGQIYEQRLAGA